MKADGVEYIRRRRRMLRLRVEEGRLAERPRLPPCPPLHQRQSGCDQGGLLAELLWRGARSPIAFARHCHAQPPCPFDGSTCLGKIRSERAYRHERQMGPIFFPANRQSNATSDDRIAHGHTFQLLISVTCCLLVYMFNCLCLYCVCRRWRLNSQGCKISDLVKDRNQLQATEYSLLPRFGV